MGWVNSLSLKSEEPRPRKQLKLVQNQDQGRTKLWPNFGITVLLPTPDCLTTWSTELRMDISCSFSWESGALSHGLGGRNYGTDDSVPSRKELCADLEPVSNRNKKRDTSQ